MELDFLAAQASEGQEHYNTTVVKRFYREDEDYDWTAVTDSWHGLETIMHRLREHETVQAVKQFGLVGRMLDVGCGSGLMLRHLPKGSVGIDMNPKNVERSKHYAPFADVQHGDAESLHFAEASFTTIICTEVLEHLVFPLRAVSEMYRVLKPGGVLIGTVPCDTQLWKLRRFSATCPVEEPFHNEMSRSDLETLLKVFPRFQIRRSYWLMHHIFVAFR